MTERETTRLVAWSQELRQVHGRLREALNVTRASIAHLLGGLRAAVERAAPPEELDQHLEGVEAIMENHFRYEERQLLTVLETLELEAEPREVLGPL